MTQGEARPGMGRESNIGRRLRVGVVGAMAIGSAVVMGGAASLVTAFAHSGSVTVAQSCTVWSAGVSLANNVTTDRWVEVVSTIPGHPGFAPKQGYNQTYGPIWSASGSAPETGKVTLNIYLNNNGAPGNTEFTTNASLPAPSNCTAAISTTASAGGAVGTKLHDSATVTGTAGSPTGTVTFALFPPSNATCSAGGDKAVYTSAAIALTSGASGTSTATDTGSYTATGTGTYHWVATYSGDSTYKGATSNCADEAVTVSQAAPSIATTASAGGIVPIAVSDSATVSGGVNPTGTVTFTLYPSSADCTAGTGAVYTSPAEALSGGKATSGSFTATTAGTYQWVAKYSGDANNASVSSACGDEPVTTTNGGGGTQAITTPSTGGTGSLMGITVGGFLLLGGLGLALVGSIVPRRRRAL